MKIHKANLTGLAWGLFLLHIFLRPFLCRMCYPDLDIYYSLSLLLSCLLWLRVSPPAAQHTRRLRYPILLFIIAIGLSTFFSVHFAVTATEIYKFIPLFAAAYAAGRTTSAQQKNILTVIVITGCLLGLYGIYQPLWGFRHILDYLRQSGPYPYAERFLAQKRSFASFFSPNMFAGYLIMAIPLSCALLLENLHQKKTVIALINGLALCVMLTALFLTKSLGGWLSLFLALLLFFMLSQRRLRFNPDFAIGFEENGLTSCQDKACEQKNRRRIRCNTARTLLRAQRSHGKKLETFYQNPIANSGFKRTALFLGVFTAILAGVLFIRSASFLDTRNPQNSFIQRGFFWQTAIKIIKDHPFTGIGLGNFGEAYLYYIQPRAVQTRFAHNSFLQIWAETGILGLAAWCWLIWKAFRRGFAALRNSAGKDYFTPGLLAANSAFLLHNLVDFDFFVPEVALCWWVILGLLISLDTNPRRLSLAGK